MQNEENINQAREDLAQAVQDAVKANEGLLESKEEIAPEAPAVPEISEMEKKAREMGWKPKGDYAGDNFVEPEEYVRRQPLFERIERQSKEVRELKDLIKQTTNHLSSVRKEAYDKAIRDLEAQQLKSVEDGDTNSFRRTSAQINEVKAQAQVDPILNQPAPAPQKDLAVEDFEKRNSSWYGKTDKSENMEMMAAASAVDQFLYNQAKIRQGISLNDTNAVPTIDKKAHLDAIESEVRRLFPNRFETKTEQPAAVGRSTATATKSSNESSLVSKLSAPQRELGLKMQRMTPAYTLEQYAKDLNDMNRLGK